MTLVSDIVSRAFRKIGVKSEDEALTADQIANGVDNLNAMMGGWPLMGINYTGSELEATDTFPLPQKFEESTVYLLAGRLSPDYEVQPVEASRFHRALQAAFMEVETVSMPTTLLRTNARRLF